MDNKNSNECNLSDNYVTNRSTEIAVSCEGLVYGSGGLVLYVSGLSDLM